MKDILKLFNKNVKHQKINILSRPYFGKIGHWLEDKMGIKHNSKNEPDINGYEMKKFSKKITFGDFSASEYAFSKIKQYIPQEIIMTRNNFLSFFGHSNPLKNNRFSWSGSCVPKYNIWNEYGQILLIDENNNICIYYSFIKDQRSIKNTFPEFLKKDVLIAIWKNEKIKKHINKKFNVNGFFFCKLDKKKESFESIHFGKPFTFETFLKGIKNNQIIFDSGMVEGNNRNYSKFRSKNQSFWNQFLY